MRMCLRAQGSMPYTLPAINEVDDEPFPKIKVRVLFTTLQQTITLFALALFLPIHPM